MKATNLLLILLACGLLSLPVTADQHPVPFDTLAPEVRDTLAPFAKDWDRLKPARQHRLVKKAQSASPAARDRFKKDVQRWKELSPADRKKLREARKRYEKLTPNERRKLRDRWERIPPKHRRGNYVGSENLSKAEKREIRERVRKMTPEMRREYLKQINKRRQDKLKTQAEEDFIESSETMTSDPE
jgi:hypothetical protein